MIGYAKLSINSNQKEIFENFIALGCDEEYVFIDPSINQKTENSIYQLTKELSKQEGKTFVVDSLKSLGKNSREIAKELNWFLENGVPIKILNIPSTDKDLVSPLQVLVENYEFLAAIEKKNVRDNQYVGIEKAREEHKHLGRKRIPYPKGWRECYNEWVSGKITSDLFREKVGLKKVHSIIF